MVIDLLNAVVYAVVSGVVGGTITGAMAFAVIKTEIKYLRRDVDHAHQRIDKLKA